MVFDGPYPFPSRSCKKRKNNLIFIFTLFCVASKGFMKALGTIKKYENKKFKLIFILIQLSEMNGWGRLKKISRVKWCCFNLCSLWLCINAFTEMLAHRFSRSKNRMIAGSLQVRNISLNPWEKFSHSHSDSFWHALRCSLNWYLWT